MDSIKSQRLPFFFHYRSLPLAGGLCYCVLFLPLPFVPLLLPFHSPFITRILLRPDAQEPGVSFVTCWIRWRQPLLLLIFSRSKGFASSPSNLWTITIYNWAFGIYIHHLIRTYRGLEHHLYYPSRILALLLPDTHLFAYLPSFLLVDPLVPGQGPCVFPWRNE